MGRRQMIVLGALVVVAVALLWLLPLPGLVACTALLAVVPPWGRSYAERGVISVIVLLGTIAILVPRASDVPLTSLTAHLGLTGFVLATLALRAVPRLRSPLPRVTTSDVLVLLVFLVIVGWIWSAYLGHTQEEVLTGLFHSGWDNQGHFVPFANTVEVGATAWPTADGSVAWNQWYPSLHSTVWSLGQLATQTAGAVSRPDLLMPFLQWTSVSFAAGIAALAWVAGDLAARGLGVVQPWARRWRSVAGALAVVAVGAFGALGSPAWLFNFGFSNFVMAVAVMVSVSYLATRSWRSATSIGWFVVPLGALVINGLWTPLVLGLVPAGAVVVVAMWRLRRWLAPVWLVTAGGLVIGTVVIQSRAISAVAPGSSGSFLEDLGAVGVGMAPFNIGVACVAPVVAVLVAVALWRGGRGPLAIAIAGPSVLMLPFLGVAMWASSTAGVDWLNSYYVLKTLDALLLASAPLLGAIAALLTVLAVLAFRGSAVARRSVVSRANGLLGAIAIGLLGLATLGYVGPTPAEFTAGFSAAPGVMAAQQRSKATSDGLTGEAILAAQRAAVPYPGLTTMLWDGAGTLPNLWLASLHGVLSTSQQSFYRNLPSFPYDDDTVEYVNFALSINRDLDLVVLWFRGVSGRQVAPLEQGNPGRVTVVQVPMRSSPLCQECSL